MVEPFFEFGAGEENGVEPMDFALVDFLDIDEGSDAFMSEGEKGFDGVSGGSGGGGGGGCRVGDVVGTTVAVARRGGCGWMVECGVGCGLA